MQLRPDPSARSSDMEAMLPYWDMIDAICGGLETMRAAGKTYLPMLEGEKEKYYQNRLSRVRFTNVFGDILSDLSLKPFMEPVALGRNTSKEFEDFSEDVNGRGDNLQVFASRVFYDALRHGMTWVFVDYTKGIPEGATLAEEREMGARPFWVHYSAKDVLAVYSEHVDGKERITHCRLREEVVERDGFEEKKRVRVRILNHEAGMEKPTWEVWEEMDRDNHSQGMNMSGKEWTLAEGPFTLSIERIPLIPVLFGERYGKSWKLEPPLRDAANLQLELYHQENGLKNIRILTAYPMLAANGIDDLPEELAIGPGQILFGAAKSDSGSSSWQILEPNGQSLEFLREDVKDTIAQIRELGRVPLTPQSSNITVITAAVAAEKGTTAIQAWVSMLDKALENMFMATGEWLGVENPQVEVDVYDRFEIGHQDADTPYLIDMMKSQLISHQLGMSELKRRGVVGKDYDFEDDIRQLDEETLGDEPEELNMPFNEDAGDSETNEPIGEENGDDAS